MTGKDKKETEYVFGYKLHIIQDAEMGIPLTGVIKFANVFIQGCFMKSPSMQFETLQFSLMQNFLEILHLILQESEIHSKNVI